MSDETKSLVKTVILLITIAYVLRASVVEAYKIPSSSMEPTLQIEDHILVNKLSYGLWLPFMKKSAVQYSEPQRGDVVVFTLPDDPTTPGIDESNTNIIKRVIGLPGETVEVRGKKVLINDKLLQDESYAQWKHDGETDFGPQRVPEGKVLLLGDNRDLSRDSRFWNDHYLDMKRIKGRAFFIYLAFHSPLRRMFSVIH